MAFTLFLQGRLIPVPPVDTALEFIASIRRTSKRWDTGADGSSDRLRR